MRLFRPICGVAIAILLAASAGFPALAQRTGLPVREARLPQLAPVIVHARVVAVVRSADGQKLSLTTASGVSFAAASSDLVRIDTAAPPAGDVHPGRDIGRPAIGRPVPPRGLQLRRSVEVAQLLARTAPRQGDEYTITLQSGGKVALPAGDVVQVETPTERVDAAKLQDARFRTPMRDLVKADEVKLEASSLQRLTVLAGGDPAVVLLKGTGLDGITSAAVVDRSGVDKEVTAELGTPKAGTLRVTLRASSSAAAGARTLRILAGRQTVGEAPLTVNIAKPLLLATAELAVSNVRFTLPGGSPEPATHYEVWRQAADPQTFTEAMASAWQLFIAQGTTISDVQVQVNGSGNVRVAILNGDASQILAYKDAPLTATEVLKVTFTEPLVVTPGELYYVYVAHRTANSQFMLRGSKKAADYAWSPLITRKPNAGAGQYRWDLNINAQITGLWHNKPAALKNPPPKPTKRALIIGLENGGLSLAELGDLKDMLPDITYASCGSFKLELQPGESLIDKLAQLASLGLHCMNPANWSLKKMTFEQWWQPVTDHIMEKISDSLALVASGKTTHKYDKVVQLRDGTFTPARMLQEIQTLSRDYQIDIHLLCHGGEETFVGDDGVLFTNENFFRPVKQKMVTGAAPLHLRAVYQMNCVSGTLVDDWRALGARVVNGTSGTKNNYMPTQYHHFLKDWLDGKTFEAAVDQSFDSAKAYFQIIYALDQSKISDSRHTVHGTGSLRMNSN